ncbi:hypothetical protein LTR85_004705 [Meristemomyces frigidus]|nr:hypothetical protein LTR85_004705 [Meristemomyces frigidus]
MANPITYLTTKAEHDAAVSVAVHTPTVIYLCNSPLPVCKAFTPKYETLAAKYAAEDAAAEPAMASGGRSKSIKFCMMELSSETSPMFKFAPNQLPVLVLMVRTNWAKTIMGADAKELEAGIQELMGEAWRG